MSQTGAGLERTPEGGMDLVRQSRQKMAPQWRQFAFLERAGEAAADETFNVSKARLQPEHSWMSSGSCQRTSCVCSR